MSDHGWTEHFTPEGEPYYHNTQTNQTQWEKPPELMGDSGFDAGDWCWMPDDVEAFVPAKLIGKYNGKVELQTQDGMTHYLSEKDYEHIELNPVSLQKNVPDLVLLDDMNIPLILHQIKERCEQEKIYTNVGTILISVNPYKRLPLYTQDVMDDYAHRGDRELPPHPFIIGDECYKDLWDTNQNQSILVSGESGAGKTECTKVILQYLAEIAGSSSGVEQRILKANPILEAFGNAKTIRNNNSSRFGKWVEIHFDEGGSICGCRNLNYLLEKSRVVYQAPNERNYHIFYQLLKCEDPELLNNFGLDPNCSSYYYLDQSGTTDVSGIDDKQEFEEVVSSMEDLGFSHEEKLEILRVVAAVLVLGNIKFKPDPTNDEKSIVDNPEILSHVADLLSVDANALAEALIVRSMTIRGEVTVCPLNVSAAEESRDSLAKYLYNTLFEWLVNRVNVALEEDIGNKKTMVIGVLDIFGFEIFEKNSFEQLCINFTNEKLQQKFNQTTFKEEEAVYNREGITYDHVDFIDNQVVLDLIEQKPNGLMVLLDEELKMPALSRSDDNFLMKACQRHADNERFKKPVKIADALSIEHYAGHVTYDVNGFLDKNKDQMYDDLIKVITGTRNDFILSIVGDLSSQMGGKKASLGSQFRQQLNALMNMINSTNPHYIRCVKPNSNKRPAAEDFDAPMSCRQLRYAGVFEAVNIRRIGYPFRLTHEKFFKRYRCLTPQLSGTNYRQLCEQMLNQIDGNWSDIQFGKTMMLYRATAQRQLDLQRNLAVRSLLIKAQALYRRHRARYRYNEMNAGRIRLREAINSRSIPNLQKEIASCVDHTFETAELLEARHMIKYLEEEIRLKSIFEGLINKLENSMEPPKMDLANLEQAVADADSVGLDNPLANTARDLLTTIHERIETKINLEEGVATHNLEMLEEAISKLGRLGIDQSSPSVSNAKREVERLHTENEHITNIVNAMSINGMFNGVTIDRRGEVSLSDQARTALNNSTNNGKSFGLLTERGIIALTSGDFLIKIRNAIQSDDWDTVESINSQVVSAGEDVFQEAPEFQAARDQVSLRKDIAETSEKLQLAAQQFDSAQLDIQLQTARTLEMEGIEPYQQLLDNIRAINAACSQALQAVDLNLLNNACTMAEQIGYPHQDYVDTRTLRDIVHGLTQELTEQLQVVPERVQIEDLCNRCQQVNLNTTQTQELNEIVNLGEEELTKTQMKAALTLGDHARVILKTVQLKELFFASFGGNFRWERFRGFKTPDEYAKAKMFGKDKLKQSFLVWTKDPIPTSLTHIEDKMAQKEAPKVFKELLGWCGEKSNAYPAALVNSILTKGITHPELRNEIFCQIIKQMKNNPSEDSKNKLWQLMYVAVKCFVPTEEFENYLEMYIKNAGDKYWYLIQTLHETSFRGPLTVAPSADEIRNEVAKVHGPKPNDEDLITQLQNAQTSVSNAPVNENVDHSQSAYATPAPAPIPGGPPGGPPGRAPAPAPGGLPPSGPPGGAPGRAPAPAPAPGGLPPPPSRSPAPAPGGLPPPPGY
eukprot:TRINITY_DN745_c0_g1_i1.p1 TRINITY_DN745_c0_g1~~TRINITY_DN745_c0_g1_i1.p1  ORF type:complete len:1528 (+),score=443.15 TRINITY_DN745_c0_g1_i1:69-4652(+)